MSTKTTNHDEGISHHSLADAYNHAEELCNFIENQANTTGFRDSDIMVNTLNIPREDPTNTNQPISHQSS